MPYDHWIKHEVSWNPQHMMPSAMDRICPMNFYHYKSIINALDNSQGALCAHKSMGELGNAAANVIALGVFGDPVGIWQDTISYPEIPQGTALLSYCEKTTPDPLCTDVTEDFPSNPIKFVDRLVAIWKEVDSTHMSDAQKEALADLMVELPKQAKDQITQLGKDIVSGHLRRWMLTPEHFWYGIDGTVKTAVDDLIRVYQG